MLDPIDQAKLCQIIRLGCPRSTAAKYVGRTVQQLDDELLRDEALSREVMRAEADAVLRHMGNVHKAASDEKNWRTSVWWLEQQARDGEAAAGDAAAGLPAAVMTILERFAELIVTEVDDLARRQGLLVRLLHIASEGLQREPTSAIIDAPTPQLIAPTSVVVEEEPTR